MSLINFLKNLLWDDDMKDVVNLLFLISNLLITGLIYDVQ